MNTVKPIEFGELSKSINRRQLFHDLQLEINAGECIVLSGDNGEGKTTLLRIMSGLMAPDSGNCQYNGTCLNWRRARNWLLQNVVYLHQDPYLFDISVLDNIAYGLRRRGYKINQARDMAINALQRFGLEHLQQRNAKQLSGGEKQRVALLRAWVLSPRLLLLDEPVASMDEQARHRTLFLIRRLLQDGVSLVITAHEPRLFGPIAERHIRLKQGRLTPAASLTHEPPASANPFASSEGDHDDQRHRP
jgi:ABC-type sulfate/molybdate transport systems ATPase subunit